MGRVIRKVKDKKVDEKKEQLIKELIALYEQLGFTARIEKGYFKDGFCLLRNQKILLLNKNLEQDKKIKFLIQNLLELPIDNIYIKPSLRDMIENRTLV
ncbi:MAG: hypothetical protein N2490_01625 [Ignavibacteria bacterium]|nr:hypothetical protein [Ignavibacteria bacterium]